jgi:hypothetical protein
LHSAKPNHLQPAWFLRNSQKFILLGKNGFYCQSRSGEWGSGLLYADFKTNEWRTVFGFVLDCDRRYLWEQSKMNDDLWIVTDTEIRKVIGDQTVSLTKVSDLTNGNLLPHLMSIAFDSFKNLYCSDDKGRIFELIKDSFKFIAICENIPNSAMIEDLAGRKLVCISILYVCPEYLLLSPAGDKLILYDRKENKFIEPELMNETFKL